jgi:hypothetical protein
LWIVRLSPSIVARGKRATSGCQSRSFEAGIRRNAKTKITKTAVAAIAVRPRRGKNTKAETVTTAKLAAAVARQVSGSSGA